MNRPKTSKFFRLYFLFPNAWRQDLTCLGVGPLIRINILSYHIRRNQMKMIGLSAENVVWWRGWGIQSFFGLLLSICFHGLILTFYISLVIYPNVVTLFTSWENCISSSRKTFKKPIRMHFFLVCISEATFNIQINHLKLYSWVLQISQPLFTVLFSPTICWTVCL